MYIKFFFVMLSNIAQMSGQHHHSLNSYIHLYIHTIIRNIIICQQNIYIFNFISNGINEI